MTQDKGTWLISEIKGHPDFEYNTNKEIEQFYTNFFASASSSLNGYPPANVLDLDLNNNDTAWVEGVKGDGRGEWISLEVTPK